MQWLGFQWDGNVRYSSDYFDALYGYAVELINKGLAYVCFFNAEEMREYRGSLTQPGKPSPTVRVEAGWACQPMWAEVCVHGWAVMAAPAQAARARLAQAAI